jgi:nucleolar complex protein 3
MAMMSSKRRKLAHPSPDEDKQPSENSKGSQKAFFKNAANWDLENDYETRQRKSKKKKDKESSRLPIKTADGRLQAFQGLDDDVASVVSDEEWLEGKDDGAASESEQEEEQATEPQKSESEQILEAQEELAKIATALNENPEDHVGAFKTLAQIGRSKNVTIQILALLTQMAVYKDVIPGYRIRPATDDAKEKLSKEVRTLRQYEQALVSGYQAYIKELARCAKLPPTPAFRQLTSIAIQCACTLVTSVPHFNFRGDLLRILVNKLSRRRVDEDGEKALKALETLFLDDEEGRPSLEAASLLSKMMKAREFRIHESVLNLFLRLRLLSEFAGKASYDSVDQPVKQKRAKREFRNKRERKAIKEQKALDKDMANADALVSHEERERMQSDTLKLVFATYFRILKLRIPHLMGAVLEGLAKYSHLINQDFFGDLLEALKDLIRHSDNDADKDPDAEENADGDDDEDDDETSPVRNLNREALLCTVTAFALLAGQDAHNSRSDLHLDLSFFTSHLYRSLLAVSLQPDVENTKNAPSGSGESKINVQTTTVLLLRSLTSVLLPPYNIRSVPPLRLAAFTKQLMTTALQLPEKSCQGVLALLGDVAHTHGKKVSSLWNTEERKGDGRYNALSETIEAANPFTATVWEGELLRKHYSPKVREGVKMVEKGMSG